MIITECLINQNIEKIILVNFLVGPRVLIGLAYLKNNNFRRCLAGAIGSAYDS